MKPFWILFLCVLLAGLTWGQVEDTSQVENQDPIDLLDEISTDEESESIWSKLKRTFSLEEKPSKAAESAYKKKEYDLAEQKYQEALVDQPESQEISFNIGNSQFKKKNFDKAIESYKKSLNGKNTEIVSSSYYNLGNAYFRKGEFAIQSGDQNGIQHYRSAMANYKKSLEINPDNQKAKQNIEVVQMKIKELLEQQKQDQQQQQQQQQNQQKQPKPSEKAKEALARAMQLVKQRRYQEAKQVLETIIQEDETAISFQSHVQRIDDVIKILAGETPRPPVQQDPRNQQPGLGVI